MKQVITATLSMILCTTVLSAFPNQIHVEELYKPEEVQAFADFHTAHSTAYRDPSTENIEALTAAAAALPDDLYSELWKARADLSIALKLETASYTETLNIWDSIRDRAAEIKHPGLRGHHSYHSRRGKANYIIQQRGYVEAFDAIKEFRRITGPWAKQAWSMYRQALIEKGEINTLIDAYVEKMIATADTPEKALADWSSIYSICRQSRTYDRRKYLDACNKLLLAFPGPPPAGKTWELHTEEWAPFINQVSAMQTKLQIQLLNDPVPEAQ